MPAFNIVRFRVKAGNEQRFIETHRTFRPKFKGFLGGHLVKTGERTFCIVGEWRNFQSIVDARPQMIGVLNSLREMLEDMGEGLGVTDPVSGESVLKLGSTAARKAQRKKPRQKVRKKTKRKPKR